MGPAARVARGLGHLLLRELRPPRVRVAGAVVDRQRASGLSDDPGGGGGGKTGLYSPGTATSKQPIIQDVTASGP